MRSKTEVQSLHETGSLITSQKSNFLKGKKTREEKNEKKMKILLDYLSGAYL